MVYCTACGEEVLWVETKNGVKIALKPEPKPLGLLYLDEDGYARPWTEHTGRSVKRYESHSYNCPNTEYVEVEDET